MSRSEPALADRAVVGPPAVSSASMTAATWRYMGDRDAADQAYCIRFAVSQAPEPFIALGGAWAYPLPADRPLVG